LLAGDAAAARPDFEALAKDKHSRFAADAPWRLADCLWLAGKRREAAAAYRKLRAAPGAAAHADTAVVDYRLATAPGSKERTALHDFLVEHPAHPLAADAARRLAALGGAAALAMSGEDRLTRAQRFGDDQQWSAAVAELMLIGDDAPAGLRTRRDYWLGTSLYKMRRRYADAGALLLDVAPKMKSPEALFHGARALSRADHDDDAIRWYREVVARYPRTPWAEEAQYLSGWLEFNRGRFRESIAPLEASIRRYPKSKWVDNARWFVAMAHYFLGEHAAALPHLEALAKAPGALAGGKGAYWRARTLQQLGREPEAEAAYRELVGRWPFSWYALLADARLREHGIELGPFGATPPAPRGPAVADTIDPSVEADPAIVAFDELESAGLEDDAGVELRREEAAFLGRHDRARGLAVLFDRYGRGNDWHRPWQLAVGYDHGALDTPADGPARWWWTHAYPEAYKELIERYQGLGGNPPYYLYSIMRKESGYDPHVRSYADAQGLLQMIPATTSRVAAKLGLPYAAGDLYDPELNIRTGSWYIGHLLAKFKGQVPLGAGAFNSGPRPVMRWLDAYGDHPIDELVELVAYEQTREYMKKVTENYARYVYLYTGAAYHQPLTVDRAYLADDLTY
ncbi:MAG TPA: transglycosylase SLT domain-containing protein, partial [Kofleriaceae bacterium]|nr:transglycosylase SLT domain-containing protein [Kofleriaceae bacterium]